MITRVKGTQDFLDLKLYDFIISQAKKQLEDYNFAEIKLPIIEYTELFQRSLGTHTDVISKEMFIIESRKAEQESSICLRPEATAAVVRAFIEDNITNLPWKVYLYGPMFRYERPQKGRFREFNQLNIEIIGSNSIIQDALLIQLLDNFFKDKLLIKDYKILLNFLGCYEDRKNFEKVLTKFLESISDKICQNCMERKYKNPLRIFDCKSPDCIERYKNAPITTDYLCDSCKQEWEKLQTTLKSISVNFELSPRLVRGLDYYDKTVFEFTSANLGAQSAFCGGGRYDRLISDISQNKVDQPAVGAAMGIERILLLLENIKDKLPIKQLKPLYLVLPIAEKQILLGLDILDNLHKNNFRADILLEENSIKSLMRKANKLNAHYLIILGEQEQNNKTVTLKNMQTGEQKEVKQSDLTNYLTS